MARTWRRVKGSSYVDYKAPDGEQVWVYPHRTWDVSPKTGMVENERITHYTVRHYREHGSGVAQTLGGRKFQSKKAARLYLMRWIKTHDNFATKRLKA